MNPESGKRKICIATGTRAEYGLLYWLLREVALDPDLELQLVVTGAHLSDLHGVTYKNIEADGFKIDFKVDMQLSDNSPRGVTRSLGAATKGFADAFDLLKPDILVVLGDRYEIFAAAQAAMIARIPIAHIHGGETTEGAIDEAIRHSITKMSHFHFATAEAYRNRAIQLGEDPSRVFTIAAPGLENIARLEFLNREELEKELNFKLGKINFVVTYHPVTLSSRSPAELMRELFAALEEFPEAKLFLTRPNADAGGDLMGELVEEFTRNHPERAICFASLGQRRYLSLARLADAVIGNSSSGIIEVPALRTPTVNVGDRQRGRLAARSIVHCREERKDIVAAIHRALSHDFRSVVDQAVLPYGSGSTSTQIKDKLKNVLLDNVLMKKFYDLNQHAISVEEID